MFWLIVGATVVAVLVLIAHCVGGMLQLNHEQKRDDALARYLGLLPDEDEDEDDAHGPA